MQITITETKTAEVAFLQVSAGVRYWEDATVNETYDTNGDLIPCRNGDRWEPFIDVKNGQILNWKPGTKAYIHYKICDDGIYSLLGEKKEILKTKEGYVPDIMCPNGEGYGDYIIMKVDENGMIKNWKQTLSGFETNSDD